jgi:hypothetical protein
MTDRRDPRRDGETDHHSPETPCTEPRVLQFPDRMQRRRPRHPVGIDDPDGSDPGPSAA